MLPQGLLSDEQERSLRRRAMGAAIADGMMAFGGLPPTASANFAQQRQQITENMLVQQQQQQQQQQRRAVLDRFGEPLTGVQPGAPAAPGGATQRPGQDAAGPQPGAAEETMGLQGYDRRASADRYFQAARDLAAMGDIDTAERYFELGESLFGTLPEPPSGQIAFGAEIHPGLDPEMTYFVDQNGRPNPLGQQAGENASTVSTIVNGFNTATREMGQRLIASETAVEALKSDNDFAVTTGLLNWLTAIGARPRVGADGQYTSESGIAPEFFRVINQLQAGGQLTETQRAALTEQINLSRQPILDRLTGFEEATAGQLRELGISETVINSVLRSARGTAQGSGDAASTSAPTPAPTPAPGGIPRVTSDAEYNRLPSGAEFIDPDGNRRRKP